MSNVIDIRTRKEYCPSRVSEAGDKAGEQYRFFSTKAIQEIKMAQAEAEKALKEVEGIMGLEDWWKPGFPKPQLRLL